MQIEKLLFQEMLCSAAQPRLQALSRSPCRLRSPCRMHGIFEEALEGANFVSGGHTRLGRLETGSAPL